MHYHFVDRAAFERMQRSGDFLETREYAGHAYGTPSKFIEASLQAGRDLVMKPEVNGAMAVRGCYPQAVLVFLVAPSPDELRQRLERRSTESRETIDERIAISRHEAEAITHYDYLIVNDHFETALAQLRAILTAERLKVARVRQSDQDGARL